MHIVHRADCTHQFAARQCRMGASHGDNLGFFDQQIFGPIAGAVDQFKGSVFAEPLKHAVHMSMAAARNLQILFIALPFEQWLRGIAKVFMERKLCRHPSQVILPEKKREKKAGTS